MKKEQENLYEDTNVLRKYLNQLKGMKFTLDCGHHVTFGYFLGNDVIIRNGKRFKIICSICGG